MFDSQQIWGAEAWPEGPWGGVTIAPGEQSCVLAIEGGLVEVELATGRVLRTTPLPPRAPTLFASSADGQTTVVRVGERLEVRRSGEETPLVLPLGSTVWPSPDGSLLLVRAPWDKVRHRDGAATLMRWRDRTVLCASDDGGGVGVVTWMGDRVAFTADRVGALHLWAAEGGAVRVSIQGNVVGLVPVVLDGARLLVTALHAGRSGRTELRSQTDGSVVRVLSATRSITGAVTTDGRIVTVQGLIVSLVTGETLREVSSAPWVGRILISPRGDRAVFTHGSRLLLFDLARWEVVRELDAVHLTPGYPFSGDCLPSGEHLVLVEAGGRVALLDAEGAVQWRFTLTRDPSWQGEWELPSWSNAKVRCSDETIAVEVEWIQRGHVQGDGFQDYEGRGRSIVLGLDGAPLDRAPPADVVPSEVTARIEKRAEQREVVVVRRGDTIVRELDVTLVHGKPSAVAIARDASWLLVGTKRGVLLGYR